MIFKTGVDGNTMVFGDLENEIQCICIVGQRSIFDNEESVMKCAPKYHVFCIQQVVKLSCKYNLYHFID